MAIQENFYNVNPPALPHGWDLSFRIGEDPKKASITVDELKRTADVNLDPGIYENKDVPEGCKVFILFHEIGHLLYGPKENNCDRFAFYHSLRAGVSPFLCYVALRAYMPEHYNERVLELGELILENEHLKNDIE